MYTTTANIALFAFLAASFWIVVSLVRLIPKKSRPKAKRHLLASFIVFVGAIGVALYAIPNQYLDYGLDSPEGLQAAIASRRAEDQKNAAVAAQEKAEQDARDKVARQAAEVADRQEKRCNDEIMAFVMSQHFIKNSLRAPATAQFPYSGDARISKTGDCTFRVQSYVDAQNGFGALIRSRTQVDMEYFPASDEWLGSNVVIVE